jgi:hypothetical protein
MGMFDSIDPSLTGEYDNYEESGFTKAVDAMPVYDKVALATAPVPIVGDVTGLIADLIAFSDDPSWQNAAWAALGVIPFVPSGSFKRASETFVQNMPNERPNFYTKGLPGQVYDTAGAVVQGLKNTQLQSISPQARANFNAEGISKTTQDVMEKQAAKARKLDEQMLQIDEMLKQDPTNPKLLKAKVEALEARKGTEKAIQGQLQQSVLFRNQYGNTSGTLLENQELLNYTNKGFSSPEEFIRMNSEYADKMNIPEADMETMFRAIRQQQKVGKKDFPMGEDVPVMMRRNKGSAAGDLNKSVASMTAKGLDGTVISPYAEVKKLLVKREFAKPLSVTELKTKVMEAAPKAARQKLLDSGLLEKLEDLRGNVDLRKAKDVNDVIKVLKKNKMFKSSQGLSDSVLRKALKTKEQQPFSSKADLIEALESKNIRVFNKDKVLKDPSQPVLITGSHQSGAMELGGVNVVTAVYPDGKLISYVNDQNDLMGVAAPAGGRALTISEPFVERVGKDPDLLTKGNRGTKRTEAAIETQREVDKMEVMDRLGGNAAVEAARTNMMPSLFSSTKEQIANAEAIRALQAPVTSRDRALAATKYALDTAARSGKVIGRQEEQ